MEGSVHPHWGWQKSPAEWQWPEGYMPAPGVVWYTLHWWPGQEPPSRPSGMSYLQRCSVQFMRGQQWEALASIPWGGDQHLHRSPTSLLAAAALGNPEAKVPRCILNHEKEVFPVGIWQINQAIPEWFLKKASGSFKKWELPGSRAVRLGRGQPPLHHLSAPGHSRQSWCSRKEQPTLKIPIFCARVAGREVPDGLDVNSKDKLQPWVSQRCGVEALSGFEAAVQGTGGSVMPQPPISSES